MRAIEEASPKKESGWGWVISIAIAVVVAITIRTFVFEPIFVSGDSMIPTLHNGESLGVEKISRYSSLPSRGEIVIVTDPDNNETLVKRVIGLPGDTIEVKDRTVFIDGKPLLEPYVSQNPYSNYKAVTVPPDTIFVMGDNRANSKDSRFFGPIGKSYIIGHALFVIWPLNEIHALE